MTTPGTILTYAPPDLLYKKTSDYYWPNFNANVTSLSDPSVNIGNWVAKTGANDGPIGFGSDVKLTSSQVSHATFYAISEQDRRGDDYRGCYVIGDKY